MGAPARHRDAAARMSHAACPAGGPALADGPHHRAAANRPRDWPDRRVGLGHRDSWLAPDPQSATTRRARRARPGAVPKRRVVLRPRHHARRQCARASGDGAAGLGLAALSTDERVIRVVPPTIRPRRDAAPEDRHRRARPRSWRHASGCELLEPARVYRHDEPKCRRSARAQASRMMTLVLDPMRSTRIEAA
jgi:hypothetical protein